MMSFMITHGFSLAPMANPITTNLFLHLLFPITTLSFPSTPPPLPVLPIPTSRQLAFHLTELSLFFHFGPNTFTDTEWTTGDFPPSLFAPSSFSPTQWVSVAKAAGFTRLILTAKHHDGFCLWPSQLTEYSVRAATGWRGGGGDVVGEVSRAAREEGIGFGVYLSPWDRHEESYGRSNEYNEYYMGQLTELLTRYGTIKEVWLDGAKGEGEKDMDYYFDSWFALIRQLQPEAMIFSDAGPDTRWIGDEAGVAGSTCWSLFNHTDAKIGGTDPLYSQIGDPFGRDWVPAECDVSIRPGWFWHASESPKSALTLLDIYYKSVGRNCLLLLNVPPNSSGLISDEDVQVLQEFAELRIAIFSNNLAKHALVNTSSVRGGSSASHFGAQNVLEEGIFTYWAPEANLTDCTLYLDLVESKSFNVLQVQEPIHMGQRIIEFHVDVMNGEGEWLRLVNGTTIGYKRLLQFHTVESQYLRLVIDKARADPLVAFIGVYIDTYSQPAEGPGQTDIRQVIRRITKMTSKALARRRHRLTPM
ncbi:hypothetical protein Droror1_Dr00003594 [Drosera rotundifolia]